MIGKQPPRLLSKTSQDQDQDQDLNSPNDWSIDSKDLPPLSPPIDEHEISVESDLSDVQSRVVFAIIPGLGSVSNRYYGT